MLKRTKVALCLLILTASSEAWSRDVDPRSDADNYAKLWATVEADRVAGQASVGTTTPLGHLDLASNLVIVQPYPGVVDPMLGTKWANALGDRYRAPSARLELGVALASGGLFVLPKLGFGYDFARKKVGPMVPQLLSIVQGGPAYFESWLQLFLYDAFDHGSQDSFYTRDLFLLALSNAWALGAQTELTLATKNSPGKALRSWPIGLRANYSPAAAVTLGLFVGYETQVVARNAHSDFITGRGTVTLLW